MACSTISLSSLPRAYSERLRAVKEVSTDRLIQRSFWRAHRRNEKRDIDHSLIPTDIQARYIDNSDEEGIVSERESDLETEVPSDVSDLDSEGDIPYIYVDTYI